MDRIREKMTYRAEQVLQQALTEAQFFQHPQVLAVHHLLGLLHHTGGMAATVLRKYSLLLLPTRELVLQHMGIGPSANTEVVPRSTEIEDLMLRAGEEARALNHHYIGTEHFLLAHGRLEGTIAHTILVDHGLTYDVILRELLHVMKLTASLPPGKEKENLLPLSPYDDQAAAAILSNISLYWLLAITHVTSVQEETVRLVIEPVDADLWRRVTADSTFIKSAMKFLETRLKIFQNEVGFCLTDGHLIAIVTQQGVHDPHIPKCRYCLARFQFFFDHRPNQS